MVGEDHGATRHDVTLRGDYLDRLASVEVTPDVVVRASFGFLLEREPRESILRQFDLAEIGRYFPEYEEEIRRQLRAGD